MSTSTAQAACADDFRSFPEDGEVGVPTNLRVVRWDFRSCTTSDAVIRDDGGQIVDTLPYVGDRELVTQQRLRRGAKYTVDFTPVDYFGDAEPIHTIQFTAGDGPLDEDFGGISDASVRVERSDGQIGIIVMADLEADKGYNAIDMSSGGLVDWARSSTEPQTGVVLAHYAEKSPRDECVEVRFKNPHGTGGDNLEGTYSRLDACWTGCRSTVSMAFLGIFILLTPLFRIRRKGC